MKRYSVTIRWQGRRLNLEGVARCSADLVSGLLEYFGAGAFITVRAK